VTYFIAVSFKENWFQLPEDGKIIAMTQVGTMKKIVCRNYRIAHLLVLHKFSLLTQNVCWGVFVLNCSLDFLQSNDTNIPFSVKQF
jgi:hypothetical protein